MEKKVSQKHSYSRGRRFGAVAAVIVALITALYLFRGVLLAPLLKEMVRDLAESSLGGVHVAIGDIRGSYVRDLEIRDVVTVQPASQGPLVFLRVGRLRIAYNLLSLFKGFNTFLSGAAVELKDARFDLDFSGDRVKPLEKDNAGSVTPLFLPDPLPRIHFQNVNVLLRGTGYTTSMKGINLETRPSPETGSLLELRVGEWNWHHPALRDGTIQVSAEIHCAKEEISIRRVRMGGKKIAESLKVNLKEFPKALPFHMKLSATAGRLEISGLVNESGLRAGIQSAKLDLAGVSSLFRLPGVKLRGDVSMQAHVFLPGGHPDKLQGDLDLTIAAGGVNRFTVDRMTLKATVREGTFLIEKMDARSGESTLAVEGVEAAVENIFKGDFAGLLRGVQGDFSLVSQNVPSLLSLFGQDDTQGQASLPPHRLMLGGRVHGGTLELSKGSLTMERGNLRLESCRLTIPAVGGSLMTSRVRASLKVAVPDLALLGRILALPALGGSVQGEITVAGALAAPKGSVNLLGRKIAFGGLTFDAVSVSASGDSRVGVINRMIVQRGNDRMEGEGTFSFQGREFENTRLKFRVSDVGRYVQKLWPQREQGLNGIPRITGSLEGNVLLAGSVQSPRGALVIHAGNITLDDTRFGDATLRLTSDGRKITVESIAAHHRKDRIDLSGSFAIKPLSFEKVRLQADVTDAGPYLRAFFPRSRPIEGALRGTLAFSGTLREPEGRADFTLRQVKVGGFTLAGAAFKGSSSGRSIDISRMSVESTDSTAVFKGKVVRSPGDTFFDVEILQLLLSGPQDSISLAPPGHVRVWREGKLFLDQIKLEGSTGAARLDGTFSWKGTSDLRVLLSNVKSGKWLPPQIADHLRFDGLNARISISGTQEAPAVSVAGDVAHLESNDAELSLSGHFDMTYGKQGISVREFTWRFENDQLLTLQGTLPVNIFRRPFLRPGPVILDARVHVPDLRVVGFTDSKFLPRRGFLEAKVRVTGSWDNPVGKVTFQGDQLYPPALLKPFPPGPLALSGTVSFDSEDLVADSIQGDSPSLTFTCAGAWKGIRLLPSLLRGAAVNLRGETHFRGDLTVKDLGWVAAGVSGLRRVSGRMAGTFAVAGPASNPTINATVQLSDGELRSDMDFPSVDGVNLLATMSPGGLRLKTFTGRLGGAPFAVTGSVQRKDGAVFVADLRLKGKNLLYYRDKGVKLRADTDVTFRGPLSRLETGGTLAVTDGYFDQYFDLLGFLKGRGPPRTEEGLGLFSIRTVPFQSMTFDVGITAVNPFKIRSNLATGLLRPDLKLGGTGEVPILTGNVYLDSGRLILPAGNVSLETGVIRFTRKDPTRPLLDVTGKSRMYGYDISLVVEGPYDEPTVTLSSVPPLSNEEVLLLVLTGRRPVSTGGLTTVKSQGTNIAVYVGKDFISRWFTGERINTDESLLDRLNVVVGREVTRAGDETIEADFRLGSGVFRKGDTLYLTGEKDAFDYYNAGLRITFRFQ